MALPLALLIPLARPEWERVVGSEERQFVPLMVGFVALIALWRMWSPMGSLASGADEPIVDRMTRSRSRFSLAALIIALMVGTFAWRVISPWMAYVAAVGIFFGWALGRYRWTPCCSVAAWLGLLLVTVRFPVDFDSRLTTRLQGLAAWGCDRALDAIWIPHLRMGNIIEIPEKRFFVEEACSGVSSLFALFAFAAVSLYVRGSSLLTVMFCLPTVPFWAVTGNFFRLLAVTAGYHLFGFDLSAGVAHERLGIVCFLISLLGYLLTESIVRMFVLPVTTVDPFHAFMQRSINKVLSWPGEPMVARTDDEGNVVWQKAAPRPETASASGGASPQGIGERVVWWQQWALSAGALLMLSLFGMSAVRGMGRMAVLAQKSDQYRDLPDVNLLDLASFPKAEQFAEDAGEGWRRVGFKHLQRPFRDPMGQHSLVWEFARGDDAFVISVDFPYRGQHALEICYEFSGWKVTEVRVADDPAGAGWPIIELALRNDLGFAAQVYYATFSEAGEPFHVDRIGVSGRLKGNPEQGLVPPICYQVQLFRESAEPLTELERRNMATFFSRSRSAILETYRAAPWKLRADAVAGVDEGASAMATPAIGSAVSPGTGGLRVTGGRSVAAGKMVMRGPAVIASPSQAHFD